MYKVSLELLDMSDSKEANEDCEGYVKKTQAPTQRGPLAKQYAV